MPDARHVRSTPRNLLRAGALGLTALGVSFTLWSGGDPRARERSRTRTAEFEAPGAGYSSAADVSDILREWAEQDPTRVRSFDLARTREGRSVRCIEIRPAGWTEEPSGARAGEGSARSRVRTVALIGGLDGRSLGGAQAVLRSAHVLLTGLDRMRDDVAVVAIPWASPDALTRALAGVDSSGRNSAAVDDDLDGRVGEDPPDDLDGDGEILEMLIEDASGAWCLAEDGRSLRSAGALDAPRYSRTREGADDDGDGLFNEDGPTGVLLDAQFPVGWASPGSDGSRGARPLVEPVAKALADWLVERRPEVTIVFGGAHGGIVFPSASLQTDRGRAIAASLERSFQRVTGRSGKPTPPASEGADPVVRGPVTWALVPEHSAPRGRAIDWFATVFGRTAFELAVWGPDVVGIDGRPVLRQVARHRHENRPWFEWVDDVRGGAGFIDWHPVDLGRGRSGLVGGWRPGTRFAPPVDCLDHAIESIPAFVQTVVEGLPRLDIEIVESRREGHVVHVGARVVNRGTLPFAADATGGAVAVELDLTCDAHLVIGRGRTPIGDLPAGGASEVMRWVAVLEMGRALELRLVVGTDDSIRREVRL